MEIKKAILRKIQHLLDLIEENERLYKEELGILFSSDQLLTIEVYRKVAERISNYTPEQLTQELLYINSIYKRQLSIKESGGPEEAVNLFWNEIDDHLRSNDTVSAIKEYRSLTGCSFNEAKRAVYARVEEIKEK